MNEREKEAVEREGTWEPLPAEGIEHFAEILKALANPARLRIVNLLTGGERTVSELCALSGLKQSLVSQQLKILRLNNIVQFRREVPRAYYSLTDQNVVRMLRCLSRCGTLR
ncbi:MAG TPA: ArsR family transcriptional regulator [Candidatus Eisenbacteria bacterium]|uniref:ArsR family transcriptional regulator n=1 Tax=Eiseniibacteriota bacterium TaxID=2212470 RepID=A0A7V2F396_UNCEI|nr:ArsR family transcriptional regulator [Candidatus Eisenbacteria bacterium]